MKRCGVHSLEVEEGGVGEEVLIDKKYYLSKSTNDDTRSSLFHIYIISRTTMPEDSVKTWEMFKCNKTYCGKGESRK